MKSAPSSASAAEDMTVLITCDVVRTAQVVGGVSSVAGHEEVATGSAAGFCLGEVGGIAVAC